VERAEIADRHLAALGLARDRPRLPYLEEITRRHVATFAFSSVGPRLGDDLPLDAASLLDRIVVRRRGGYCFEQNGLLFEVLSDLGFRVRLLLARVVNNQDVHPGLTHRITLVELDEGPFVADVGFGPLGPPRPVPMPPAEDASGFRVVERRPGEFHMQSRVEGEPFSLYRFELATYGPSDCEVGHFYSHRHPDAVFVNNLVASRILDAEIRSLRNRDYWVLRPGGDVRTRVDSPRALRILLEEELGVHVSDNESRRLFEALPS
jgi:N-hydroxyarylamine O-acetyltransferase